MFGINVWQSVEGGTVDAALGAGGGYIHFSGSLTVPEDTATSTNLGTFSVVGGSGSYTFAFGVGGNPGSKFTISTADLILTGALDYETTTSYLLVIEATNGVDPTIVMHTTIQVGNVFDDAATLSLATGASTGVTTASGTVSTDQASGTMYAVTSAGSTPSAAQVKAGQDSNGIAATYAGSHAATLGVNSFTAGGLIGSTTYKWYFMQENTSLIQSTVAASASFTTDAPLTQTGQPAGLLMAITHEVSTGVTTGLATGLLLSITKAA